MSPMVEADCPGLQRDPATGKLIPTNQDKPQSSVNEYKYTVGKASSLDRLFDFRSQDPTLPAPEVATEADGAYEVETVVGRRVSDSGKVEYLIKWAGWEAAHNSWEPALGICGSLTRAYDRQHPFTAAENALRPNKRRRLAQAPLRPARGAGCARARLSTAARFASATGEATGGAAIELLVLNAGFVPLGSGGSGRSGESGLEEGLYAMYYGHQALVRGLASLCLLYTSPSPRDS